jgi:hypothetical protein
MPTNHIMKRPQVVVGEGVDPTDFNNLAAAATYQHELYLSSQMRRQLVHGEAPTARVNNPADASDVAGGKPALYAVANGAAPRNGATACSYRCNPGLLYYVSASPVVDGVNIVVPAYYVQKDEIAGSFANGDATHPRFDAVYVRLSVVDSALASRNFEDASGVKSGQNVVAYKETKLETLAVTGTPAVKPLIPAAPDATWALWGVWYTAQSQNTAHSLKQIFDYRVPIGLKRLFCYPGAGAYAIGASATATPPTG